MHAMVAAGAGFLLAVLWFDLMFDVQVRGLGDGELPDPVLASIAGYYRRVTTQARPMNLLIAVVMLGTLVAIIMQLVRDDAPRWVSVTSIVLAVGPIGLARVRTVPNAVRLGSRRDPTPEQTALAKVIYRDHLFCLASIATLLVIQLIWA